MMSADPSSGAQRRRDTERRLTHDIDVWVASASADGATYLNEDRLCYVRGPEGISVP